jgi:hypothetical protein
LLRLSCPYRRIRQGAEGYLISDPTRHDERDISFARIRAVPPGSPTYKAYYTLHPEREAKDAARRQKGLLGEPGRIDRRYRPNVAMMEASFDMPNFLGPFAEATPGPERPPHTISPERATEIVKNLALTLGADMVGICKVNPNWVYSHRGEIFYDRWDETGLEAGFSLNFKRLKLKTRYVKANRSPIQVTNEMWSLTNSNRPLRSNLITENRDMESIISAAAFRTTGYSPVSTGFAVLTEVEWLLKSNGLSDPNFRLFSMILGGWEMSEGIIIRGRSILGRSSEAVPAYRMFGVGGLGSVSGHRYKIQSGSTMEQVNLELVFTEEFTQKGFLFKIFYDGGRAYSPSTQPAEMLQGAGFGFGTSKKDGLGIGFNIARALDGKGPVESTVRLNYNF